MKRIKAKTLQEILLTAKSKGLTQFIFLSDLEFYLVMWDNNKWNDPIKIECL